MTVNSISRIFFDKPGWNFIPFPLPKQAEIFLIIWFFQLSWQCKLATVKRFESWNRSDEWLTLETSAFESLYGGQFTFSTQLIKPNYLVPKQVCLKTSLCQNKSVTKRVRVSKRVHFQANKNHFWHEGFCARTGLNTDVTWKWSIISNCWMRLSRIWRILQIKKGAIHRGRRLRWITLSEIFRILIIWRRVLYWELNRS